MMFVRGIITRKSKKFIAVLAKATDLNAAFKAAKFWKSHGYHVFISAALSSQTGYNSAKIKSFTQT